MGYFGNSINLIGQYSLFHVSNKKHEKIDRHFYNKTLLYKHVLIDLEKCYSLTSDSNLIHEDANIRYNTSSATLLPLSHANFRDYGNKASLSFGGKQEESFHL